jgi:hypothetical protein
MATRSAIQRLKRDAKYAYPRSLFPSLADREVLEAEIERRLAPLIELLTQICDARKRHEVWKGPHLAQFWKQQYALIFKSPAISIDAKTQNKFIRAALAESGFEYAETTIAQLLRDSPFKPQRRRSRSRRAVRISAQKH